MKSPMSPFKINFQTDKKPFLGAFFFGSQLLVLILRLSCLLKRDVLLGIPASEIGRQVNERVQFQWNLLREEKSKPALSVSTGLLVWDIRAYSRIRLCLYNHSDTNSMNSISQWFQNDVGRFTYNWKSLLFYRKSLTGWEPFPLIIFFPTPNMDG